MDEHDPLANNDSESISSLTEDDENQNYSNITQEIDQFNDNIQKENKRQHKKQIKKKEGGSSCCCCLLSLLIVYLIIQTFLLVLFKLKDN